MNPFQDLRDIVIAELDGLMRDGVLPGGLDSARVSVEPPRDPAHGEVATNAAMVLAKPAGMKPRALAEALAERLGALELITEVEVAGPGFINLRIAAAFWQDCLAGVLRAGADYGRSELGAGVEVNVEYVSVNPTGPLHVGHARGAVYGDALAALLERAGFEVTREYYINDAGAQIDALGRSTYLRYREALGESIDEAAFEGLYTARHSAKASTKPHSRVFIPATTSRRWARRLPLATVTGGSVRTRMNGSARCAISPSTR
jgi:arginyl-tRNA synthetase